MIRTEEVASSSSTLDSSASGGFALLSNGVRMPRIGLGTFEMKDPDELTVAISSAIKAGYRSFDTAQCYKNEEIIGKCIWSIASKFGLSREDIFLTSKLHPSISGYENVLKSIRDSLNLLSVSYLDLFLIHWPGTTKVRHDSIKNLENRKESWRALMEAYRLGLVRSIGVSNFNTNHLKLMKSDMLNDSMGLYILPMVNQIEIHPLFHPLEDIAWCKLNGIYVQAYSSLGRSQILDPSHQIYTKFPFLNTILHRKSVQIRHLLSARDADAKVVVGEEDVFHVALSDEPVISESPDKTLMAHIFLRWGYQHQYGLIPKSKNPDRIKKNLETLQNFQLDEEEMKLIDSICIDYTKDECNSTDADGGNKISTKICWDSKSII